MFSKRLISAILCVITLFGTILALPRVENYTAVKATSVSEYQQYIKDLEAEQKEIKKEINKLKGDKSDQNAIKTALQKNVDNLQSQITACNQQIAELDGKIADLEAENAKKSQELEESKYVFRQRLRAIYMSGGSATSNLAVIFNAENLEELLTKSKLTQNISAYDKSLMQKIVSDMKAIENNKKYISDFLVQQGDVKKILNSKKSELMVQLKEVDVTLNELEGDIDKLQDKIAALEKAQKEYEQAIKDAQNVGSDQKYSGDFAWPVPGYHYISSPYGYRNDPWSGAKKFHKGVDIAGSGIKGKPIVAAADGIVSLAKYNSGGYGYYVMVNHGTGSDGKTYVTLYAHMTKYIVSVGQKVKKGQTIGYVGTSGASTGYHLHYEIRVNGDTTNPMSYYK